MGLTQDILPLQLWVQGVGLGFKRHPTTLLAHEPRPPGGSKK